MEQTCLSDMRLFYEGALIRQLNTDVQHALALKSYQRHSVMFLLCFVALCLTNLIYLFQNSILKLRKVVTVTMSMATSIKEALRRWEEKYGMSATEATEVQLCFQWPPIEKMDNSLAALAKCEKLSLSTNVIEKITGISSLKNLRILSVGRNYIKNFSGLESLGDTLEELWISYNLIEKLKGVGVLKKLRVLYMSNNLVKEWTEFNKLQDMPNLEDLVFVGNPLYDNLDEATWKAEACKRLPNLKKLDGEPVIREVQE